MLKSLLWFDFNYISFYWQIQPYLGKLENFVECFQLFSNCSVFNDCAFAKFSLKVSRAVERMKNVITTVC